jgi:hypothetical protein
MLFSTINANQNVAPYFYNRSQERNLARDLAGWTDYINQPEDPDKIYGALAITPEYTHSFRPEHMTVPLFGNSLHGCNNSQLTISGTQTTDRSPQDLLADYFYLPPDFKSTVEFTPVIDNFLVDFSWYLGLDPWSPGLYLWLHAPLVHTRWDLNITENVIDSGIDQYAPGYFAPSAISRGKLLEQFIDYAQGVVTPNVDTIVFEELKFARMSNRRLAKTRFAEFRLRFGKNFICEEDRHFGMNLQVAAPAGLRPEGKFLFEPMVGNGHHWELGFATHGSYTFWENEEKMQWWSFYADADITHLFKSHQKRVFDLTANGPLSRYMLATEMKTPATNLLGGGTTPSAQFNNKILPVANITALDVNVSIAVQADIVFMFNFISEGLSFDLGYNYWGRSHEIIKLKTVDAFDANRFAIKGDAQIFGFVRNSDTAVALSATESKATVHAGTNFPATGTTNQTSIETAQKNPTIDFPQPATTNPSNPDVRQNLQFQPNNTIDADQIKTSVNPVLLSSSDVNVANSGTSGSSNKLFTHLSYTWVERDGWIPYVGIGGEVEFAQTSTNTKKMDKKCRIRTGASQWGIWIKGGVTFY